MKFARLAQYCERLEGTTSTRRSSRWSSSPLTSSTPRGVITPAGRTCKGESKLKNRVEATMIGQSVQLGKIWEIPIGINASWFVVFVLLTLSLVTQFAELHPHWSSAYHYTIGVLTSVLFFASVLLHELGHSAVALRKHIPIRAHPEFRA